jgi:hypothetical protein
MARACMEVEFLAGTDVRDAINEAKRLAKELNLAYIKFKFNGISFSVGSTANTDRAVDKYVNATAPRKDVYIIEN